MNSTTESPDHRHRYEQLAGHIVALINQGVLLPGSKAPSLRSVCKQQAVSIGTALQAYRLLEDKGVLLARPKSGFFVAGKRPSGFDLPKPLRSSLKPSRVALAAPALRLLENASNPQLQPLGCAVPSASLLAVGKLDRYLARAARIKGDQLNIYGTPHGDPDLRREIARRAIRWGQALDPDNVAITCGCTEALALALKVLTKPGDVVAIESPTYFGVLQVIDALGLQVLELPTKADTGLNLNSLEKALAAGRVSACLFSSGFSNPLGASMPEDKKRELLDILVRYRVPLIEDDVYGDLHFDQERPRPFMALGSRADIIYCSSFSKTLAPGYRVGWIVMGKHSQKILESKFALSLCSPNLPQVAIADFLSAGGYDHHLRRVRRALQSNIEHTLLAIDASFPPGTRVSRPSGGFVLWVELPRGADSAELLEQALAKKICFASGNVFSSKNQFRHCLRLSCGHEWSATLEQAVRTIGQLACEQVADAPGERRQIGA